MLKLPPELEQKLSDYIQEETERKIADYPIYVHINGDLVDIDESMAKGGQINLFINDPVYCSKTGEKMAVVKWDRVMKGE